jgi:hypothetical protein
MLARCKNLAGPQRGFQCGKISTRDVGKRRAAIIGPAFNRQSADSGYPAASNAEKAR